MEKFFRTLRTVLYSAPGRGAVSSALLCTSFLAMFSSVPPLSAYVSESRAKGFLVIAFGALFSFILGGVWTCLLYSVVVASASLVIGELIKSGKSFGVVVFASSGVLIAMYAAALFVYTGLHSTGVMDVLINAVNVSIDIVSKGYPKILEQQLVQTGMSKKEFVTATAIQLPSIAGVAILIFVFVNVLMSAKSVTNISKFLKIENLKRVKLPEALVWFAISVGAFYLYSQSEYNKLIGIQSLGLFLFRTLAVVYFLQGMLIVRLLFASWLGEGLLSVMMFSLLIVFAYMFVVAIGFFDIWFNFRKYIKKGEQS